MDEYAFDTDTRVTPTDTNEHAATITDRWSAIGGRPNGGYLVGIALQALRQRLPLPDPLAVSAFFLRPATAGPATVRTELVRTGRTVATGEARLVQDGRELVRVVASFTDLTASRGRTLMLQDRPALPPPDDAIDLVDGRAMPDLTITERVRYRVPAVPGWASGAPSGDPTAVFWMGFADGRDADPIALVSLVDAAWPVVVDIGAAGSVTVELTVHVRARPAPGWLACRVSTRYVTGGYHEEDFEIWDSRGALVAQSRQLAVLP